MKSIPEALRAAIADFGDALIGDSKEHPQAAWDRLRATILDQREADMRAAWDVVHDEIEVGRSSIARKKLEAAIAEMRSGR